MLTLTHCTGFAAGGAPPDTTAPTITSSNTASNAEGVALAHALTANESVSWTIVGGADQARFEISGSTLRWASNGVKDFEAPDDSDTNNTYVVDVRATDLASNTTDQTITVTVTDVADTPPLDGLSDITGAWSFSRKLLTAYGGAFYAATGGAIDTLNDQSGSSRDFTQATADAKPTETTLGPNSRAAARFNTTGVDDYMAAAAISTFITNSVGYFVVSCLFDTLDTNAPQSYNNHAVIGDSGSFIGLHAKSTGVALAYNWDGGEDAAASGSSAVTTATPYVLEWWHSGGNINLRINGGTTFTLASGNTSTMTGALRIGTNAVGPAGLNGRIESMVAFNVLPTSGERDALVANMMAWVGAV